MNRIRNAPQFARTLGPRLTLLALLLALIALLGSTSGARADNFFVSSVAELVTAINDANNEEVFPGPDTITLMVTDLTVSAIDNNSPASGGNNAFPVITSNIAINFNGPGRATIERGGGVPMRFFEIDAGGSLTLVNITLSNGRAEWGGAIRLGARLLRARDRDAGPWTSAGLRETCLRCHRRE